jgi:predicted MPP superfamily phosphohydrolase
MLRAWLFPLQVALAGLFLFGHAALVMGVVNRVHGFGLPRKWIKGTSLAFYVWFFFVPLGLGWLVVRDGWPNTVRALLRDGSGDVWTWTYLALTWLAAVWVIWHWVLRQKRRTPPQVRLVSEQSLAIHENLQPRGTAWARFWQRAPQNEVAALTALRETCQIPNLPAELQGLSIAHLSDLHMCRIWTIDFFHALVDHVQELSTDIVVLTGDICDHAECIPWIEPTLGRLCARHGKYYVLGNHDPRTRDVAALQRAMHAAGFVALGQQSTTLDIAGRKVMLAGNEAPWFAPPSRNGELKAASTDADLAILLLHTPDLFRWGREQGFDLIFAGHAHGGQIRLPVIGPIACPCRNGTKFASGWFAEDNQLMRVSRGSASIFPFRLNCRPEIGRIEIVLESSSD